MPSLKTKGIPASDALNCEGSVKHQFRVALDANEHVAIAQILVVFGPNALFFFAQERPDFIAFHIAHRDIANVSTHDLFALLASEIQEFQDRVAVQFGRSLNAAHAGTLQKHSDREQRHFRRDGHCAQWLRVFFGIRFAALGATETAKAIAMFTE
jgi:hypothetical protein